MRTSIGHEKFFVISSIVNLIIGVREANNLVFLGVERAKNRITIKRFHSNHGDRLRGDVTNDAEDLLGPGTAGLLLEESPQATETDVRADRW